MVACLKSQNADRALLLLREALHDRASVEAQRLPTERVLAASLGQSRTAIRRALDVLEKEGLIWRRQGAGTFLGPKPDIWDRQITHLVEETDYQEVMEVRLRIEPQLAQLAALRADKAALSHMRDMAARLQECETAQSRELYDGLFHRAIAETAGNRLFLSLFDLVNKVRQDPAWQTVREFARQFMPEKSHLSDKIFCEHRAIIDAIADHDPARAGEAMREHLLQLQQILLRQTAMDYLGSGPINLSEMV